jgi:hypothetical protein
MLKMRDLLQEGRNLQEKFKKNVLSEAQTIKSKLNPALSIKVGDDSITLVTPYGSITFEVAGQYDDFSTDGGVAMDYTKAKGGITQSEWKNAADAIFDFVSNEPDYLKATEKLINSNDINKYIPKLVGKPMPAGKQSSSSKISPARTSPSDWDNQDPDKLLKKIPSRYRNEAEYEYVGTALGKSKRFIYYPLTDIADEAYYEVFNTNSQKTIKYLQSLYMKPGKKDIYTNFRGKEELELAFVSLD